MRGLIQRKIWRFWNIDGIPHIFVFSFCEAFTPVFAGFIGNPNVFYINIIIIYF